jgi:hypothetical protein
MQYTLFNFYWVLPVLNDFLNSHSSLFLLFFKKELCKFGKKPPLRRKQINLPFSPTSMLNSKAFRLKQLKKGKKKNDIKGAQA